MTDPEAASDAVVVVVSSSSKKRTNKAKWVQADDPHYYIHVGPERDPLPPGEGHILLRPADTNDYAYGHLFKNFLSKHRREDGEDIVISLLPVSRLATQRYTLQDVLADDDILTALWYFRESIPCWVFGFDLVSRMVTVWGRNHKTLVTVIATIKPDKWESLATRLVNCYRFHYTDQRKPHPRVLHFIRYHSGMRFAKWWRETISVPRILPRLPRFNTNLVSDLSSTNKSLQYEAYKVLIEEQRPLKKPRLDPAPVNHVQAPVQPQGASLSPLPPRQEPTQVPLPPPPPPPPPPVAAATATATATVAVVAPAPLTTMQSDVRPVTSVFYKWSTHKGLPVLCMTTHTEITFPESCFIFKDMQRLAAQRVLSNMMGNMMTAYSELNVGELSPPSPASSSNPTGTPPLQKS